MAQIKILKFNSKWNMRDGGTSHKLHLKCFTTIRVSQEKYKLGNQFEIQLNGVDYGIAKIVDIREFKLNDMSEAMAFVDTGYNKEKAIQIIKNMYPDIDWKTKNFAFITLEYIY